MAVGKVLKASNIDFVARTRTSKYEEHIDVILELQPEEALVLEVDGVDRDENPMTTEKFRMHIASAIRNSVRYNKERNPNYRHTVRTTEDGDIAVYCSEKKPKEEKDTNSGAKGKLANMKNKAGKKK